MCHQSTVIFIRKGLSLSREERFNSASEMLAELEQILNGEFARRCPRTRIKSHLHRFMKWLDRNPYQHVKLFYACLFSRLLHWLELGLLWPNCNVQSMVSPRIFVRSTSASAS